MDKNELHSGHRARIDEKSEKFGIEFLEEHEQLERLLFAVIPRGNTNEIAHRLLEKFGSLYGVLTADADNLVTIDGVGSRAAKFLHDMPGLLGIVKRSVESGIDKRTVLDTEEKAGEYAKTLFYGKVVESLYMVSLNSARQVIRFDKISEGSVSATDVSVHKIAGLAVMNKASYILLAHNHPGGSLDASMADYKMTKEIKNAMDVLGIKLIGHCICACGKWSMI